MKLKTIDEIKNNSKVILRLDTDLPISGEKILDHSRLEKSIVTIIKLLNKNCKISIIGHMGRPDGKRDPNLSLNLVYIDLITILEKKYGDLKSVFVDDFFDKELILKSVKNNQIIFFENVRFWSGEEENNKDFLEILIKENDLFINDAFAVAHRASASTTLFEILPTYYGDSFNEEYTKLEKLICGPERPITLVLGGAKKDKLSKLDTLLKSVDYILVGGKLPSIIDKEKYKSEDKIIIGEFEESGFDISQTTIDKFEDIISCSKTIIWAGAMGFYENENYQNGTNKIAFSIANAEAYKVIAGGDTGASIINLGLKNKIDFICSGGGVVLDFLANKALPTIKK